MSLQNFIPEVWSSRLLVALRKALVYGSDMVINRDYEGEIAEKGDTVRISMIGDVTIANYARDTDIAAPQALQDAQVTLTIDQQKYFNFAVDDVDRAQMNVKVMDEAISRAAYNLADVADQFIAANYTGVAAVNQGSANGLGDSGSPITLTSDNAYTTLVALRKVLNRANVPSAGRFCVVDPGYEAMLLLDPRFVNYGTQANRQTAESGVLDGPNALGGPQGGTPVNGLIGRMAGFDIFVSNNVPNTNGTLYKAIAGHPMAWTYAEQMTKTEAYRPPLRFSDAVKGLHIYGAKLLRPYALAVATYNA